MCPRINTNGQVTSHRASTAVERERERKKRKIETKKHSEQTAQTICWFDVLAFTVSRFIIAVHTPCAAIFILFRLFVCCYLMIYGLWLWVPFVFCLFEERWVSGREAGTTSVLCLTDELYAIDRKKDEAKSVNIEHVRWHECVFLYACVYVWFAVKSIRPKTSNIIKCVRIQTIG